MRILQINSVANSGSTGRISENIGLVLKEAGHESYLAFGRPSPQSNLATIQIGNKFDVYAHGLKTVMTDKHGFGSKRATKNFIKEVEKLRPDAIGIHNLHGYYINIEVLFHFLKASRIPIVWTFHDCWPFTGHCTYFDNVSCDKWKKQCYACPKTKAYPKSLTDNSIYNFHNKKMLFTGLENLAIVTPSQWLKRLVKQSFLKEYKVSVVHNGIDLKVFKPTQSYFSKKNIVLGVASIWDERKGLQDFHQLREELDENFEIVLIGLSKKQIGELPQGIKGIERTENQAELVDWYNKALCFVNPTYQDNFPTTNVEALACGTPVVTYDTGGSPEAMDEHTGRVVDKGDVIGLAQAVIHFALQDPGKLSGHCRQRAEMLFDHKERFTDYLILYQSLVSK